MEFGTAICARIDELAAISAEPGMLTRFFLSPEQRRAGELVLEWMREAGMSARLDAIGNVVGRYEGERPGLPALVLGSHLDTVRDAGKYDGMLGVVTAIACVGALHREGARLPFAIEVFGFCDEEGVRFGSTLLGSRAVAGTFDSALLEREDCEGTSMAQAMLDFGLDPQAIFSATKFREEILAYVELHIEQGPVLERMGLAVGCVSAISGAERFAIEAVGKAGHAGTLPMNGRQDALAAAAECVLAVERACAGQEGLVGTVGRLDVTNGAVNVVSGHVGFTLDVRAPEDAQRRRAVEAILAEIERIGARRNVTLRVVKTHEGAATPCAAWLMERIDAAIAAEGIEPVHLPSGAGHDAMAMAAIADIGMIFVRCTEGISHNPAEAIAPEYAEVGARVLLGFIRNFSTRSLA